MTGSALDEEPTLGGLLRRFDAAAPDELVGVCDRWVRRAVGARGVTLLLVDYGQAELNPVPGGRCSLGAAEVSAGPAGVAYREQRTVEVAGPVAEVTVHLPVTLRGERIGVLTVELPTAPTATACRILDDVARVLAHVLTGASRFTDRFEVLRRRRDLSLAAEIQWELLPVLAYELPEFSLAGALEPTYDIGGDTFDYAVSASRLTVSVTDAVGHGLRAALMGSLAVTAMRNCRRGGGRVVEQAVAAGEHLATQFTGSEFVTGLVLELDLSSGSGGVVNAGHPLPLLLRDGEVTTVSIPPDRPMGLYPGSVHHLHRMELRPGDRLLMITDGISEAHSPGGPLFGVERVGSMLAAHAQRSPVEFVRLLTRAVLEHRSGALADDATAVCLDWR